MNDNVSFRFPSASAAPGAGGSAPPAAGGAPPAANPYGQEADDDDLYS